METVWFPRNSDPTWYDSGRIVRNDLHQLRNSHLDVDIVVFQVLARWVGDQRKQMKAKSEGKPSILTDEREQRLRDVGFVFNTRTREHLRNSVLIRFQDRWNDCFQRLLQFKEQFGHAAVPRRWKADKDLASWAMRQV